MCKAFRDKKLEMILRRKCRAIPLAESRRIGSDIHGDIKDFAFKDIDQLSLGSWILKVKTPEDATS